MDKDFYRGFTDLNRCYWFRPPANPSQSSHIPQYELIYGLYHLNGGTDGELILRWYPSRRAALAVQLESFSDTWKTLAAFHDVTEAFSKISNRYPQPSDIKMILFQKGFQDRTQYAMDPLESQRLAVIEKRKLIISKINE